MNILFNSYIKFNYAGLFSTEDDWIHPDRVENTYEIMYITAGEVYLNDEVLGEICLTKGSLAILEPGKRHYGSKISKNTSFYWVHFSVSEESELFKGVQLSRFDNPHLFKELLHFAFLPSSPEYLVNSILIRILSEIRYLCENTSGSADKAAEEIYEWIRANAGASLTAEKTARHFGFSSDHITRIIKKSYGVGTRQLIDRFILSKAKELLANTGKYIKEIAFELGFDSDKAFIGFFKYHEGVFPSEFRNKFYKIHMNSK